MILTNGLEHSRYITHSYMDYASSTQLFVHGDTKDMWLDNMSTKNIERRTYLESRQWDAEDAIRYEFNSYGFRTDEFETFTGDYFVSLGCSFTFGIGLPEHHIWPHVLSRNTGLPVCNLGVPGAAVSTVFRMAYCIIPYLPVRPKFICLFIPPDYRIDIIGSDRHTVKFPSDVTSSNRLVKEYFVIEENIHIDRARNVMAIQQLANNLDIPIFIQDSNNGELWYEDKDDYARDFAHQGPARHIALAKHFNRQISSL